MKQIFIVLLAIVLLAIFAEPTKKSEEKPRKENKGIFGVIFSSFGKTERKLTQINSFSAKENQPFNAQKWLEKTNNKNLMPYVKKTFGREIALASKKYGIDREIIAAIIVVESSGNPIEVGDGGQSRGLMGVKTLHARKKNLPDKKLFDPETNILIGTEYLREMADHFKSIPKGIVAYNSGPSRIKDIRESIYYRKVMALIL